jgi:hypothetical protein
MTDEEGFPRAEAMDLFQIRPDGVPTWQASYLKRIADWIKSESGPLDWGGDWVKFVDNPHFQLKRASAVLPAAVKAIQER